MAIVPLPMAATMLGDGVPLFPQVTPRNNPELVTSEIFSSGVVQLTYRVKNSIA
jgi:hypothetical protein